MILVPLALLWCVAGQQPNPRIIGGLPAAPTQFPWVAYGIVTYLAPGYVGFPLAQCTGSLIADYSGHPCSLPTDCVIGESCLPAPNGSGNICQATWLLSAAHCLEWGFSVFSGQLVPQWTIGNADRTSPLTEKRTCTEIYIHQEWNESLLINDISLCKIAPPSIGSTPARALVLQDDSDYTATGDSVLIAGYGFIAENATQTQTVLRYVSVHASTNPDCQANIDNLPNLTGDYSLFPGQLCADGNAFGDVGKDSCVGDSGGPVFVHPGSGNPFVLGITSFGWGCANGPPSINTRVSYYYDWILARQRASRDFEATGTCLPGVSIPMRDRTIICGLTDSPTIAPTVAPSSPTTSPTTVPTLSPASLTRSPTSLITSPTTSPTTFPTSLTKSPTISPTTSPTRSPTRSPTTSPTTAPTPSLTTPLTTFPTVSLTVFPTGSPTASPTTSPTTPSPSSLTSSPTTARTLSPTTSFPTEAPTRPASLTPTTQQPTTVAPTHSPISVAPTRPTTHSPTPKPTTKTPTLKPTRGPTSKPSTRTPTSKPSAHSPTPKPTTHSPIPRPTTKSPTAKPTRPPTEAPTTKSPTARPTTKSPTARPTTKSPTARPTTRSPTPRPTTKTPTQKPTTHPTVKVT